MGGAGESAGAVLLCLAGGGMNCTWPLFSKLESPNVMRIVSPGGWEWENVWLVFILWSTLLNVVLCVGAIGPSTLRAVYDGASTTDFTLVCVFSFLWGSGTMCYSLGVQMLGAGPGIALVMSLLVVIGTLLPLIEDHADNADSPASLVTMLGLVFAISGFVTSAYSSHIKDRTKMASTCGNKSGNRKSSDINVENIILPASNTVPPSDPESASTVTVRLVDDSSGKAFMDTTNTTSSDDRANAGAANLSPTRGNLPGGVVIGDESTRNPIHKVVAGEAEVKTIDIAGGKQDCAAPSKNRNTHLKGVAVCAVGAVMSSMLQFSFVFGEPLVAQAEDEEGVRGVLAPLVIWLLAFSLAGLWNVIYACCLLFKNGTWGRYITTNGGDLMRHFIRLTAMSLFFVGHIHMYGFAQYLFGGLGPVIAWPLLMSSTVLGGQLWGVFMKEWVGVPHKAVRVNIASISLLVTAVTVIAIAGSVL